MYSNFPYILEPKGFPWSSSTGETVAASNRRRLVDGVPRGEEKSRPWSWGHRGSTPSKEWIRITDGMFKALWERRERSQRTKSAVLEKEVKATERQIEQALDRIVSAESSMRSAFWRKNFPIAVVRSDPATRLIEPPCSSSRNPRDSGLWGDLRRKSGHKTGLHRPSYL